MERLDGPSLAERLIHAAQRIVSFLPLEAPVYLSTHYHKPEVSQPQFEWPAYDDMGSYMEREQ